MVAPRRRGWRGRSARPAGRPAASARRVARPSCAPRAVANGSSMARPACQLVAPRAGGGCWACAMARLSPRPWPPSARSMSMYALNMSMRIPSPCLAVLFPDARNDLTRGEALPRSLSVNDRQCPAEGRDRKPRPGGLGTAGRPTMLAVDVAQAALAARGAERAGSRVLRPAPAPARAVSEGFQARAMADADHRRLRAGPRPEAS